MKRTEKSKEIETYETKNADLESGRPRNYIFDRPSFAKWNFIYATFKPLRGRELHELYIGHLIIMCPVYVDST